MLNDLFSLYTELHLQLFLLPPTYMWVGNVFILSVCLSVCVHALTFEGLDIEASLLVRLKTVQVFLIVIWATVHLQSDLETLHIVAWSPNILEKNDEIKI